MAWLSEGQIRDIGFRSVGSGVLISSRASFYNCSEIRLGDRVRIDDYAVISAGAGGVTIGNYVHVAVYTSLIGAGPITVGDYCNLSSRVSIYSSNDDYSGEYMVGPLVPQSCTNVLVAPVSVGKHVVIGSGSVVLPGVRIGLGVAVGALSLVNRDCEEFGVYGGVPARRLKERSRNMLQLEKSLPGLA